jgi:ATP-binding protein involved in chromosome partitioning
LGAFDLEATTPIEIARRNEQGRLSVRWKDGHVSLFSLKDLRMACLCAACVDERTGVRVIRRDQVPEGITASNLELVGHYGLRVHWSDGHNTGIYDFEYLRKLCPCAACSQFSSGNAEGSSL